MDDNSDILEVVGDILASLGHEHDNATCQDEARELLERNAYSYYLLDLEIPVHSINSLPRIQNGENLLAEVVRRRGTRKEPIIIITGHGTECPDLAVRMMKLGADDYVTKPFPDTGNTLDRPILDALGCNGTEKAVGKARTPPRLADQRMQFQGGRDDILP